MGAAEDVRAPTEERSCVTGRWLLIDGGGRGRPRSDRRAFMCYGTVTSDRWGRPRTSALRQKSVRVLRDGGFCSTGSFLEIPFSLADNEFNYLHPFFVKMGIGDPTTEL